MCPCTHEYADMLKWEGGAMIFQSWSGHKGLRYIFIEDRFKREVPITRI